MTSEAGRESASPLICAAVCLCTSLGVVLALPNQNITYYDDLAVMALFGYPAFAVLVALIGKSVQKRKPSHLKLLVACSALGAFHLNGAFLHAIANHDLKPLISHEKPVTDGEGLLDFISGTSQRLLTRSRILSHGSGSYVFEEIYRTAEESERPLVTWSYSANQSVGFLPNWTVPIRVIPWRFKPQYWVCLNQSRPRRSVLLTTDDGSAFSAMESLPLYVAALLVLLPYGLALLGRERMGWIWLGVWVVVYQPWWAWFW
ncbi:MAG: hypothetical protein KC800_09330 [Candidatus Eremiobacteraeota bacterium]|nr:hypothetical protein [Candidatus Eremiobacteraeota bacterium]